MKQNNNPRRKKQAVAYFRTSSAANVGGDSDVRQRVAVNAYAKQNSFQIAIEIYDAAVSGADPLESREGFRNVLSYIAANPDCQTVMVETANRFARDMIVQELGFRMLKNLGIKLVAVDSPDSFVDDTPTATLVRQVLGAVAEFDKAATVSKLKAARDRKREATGKCEGRKPMAELYPAAVKRTQELSRKRKRKLSLRKISAQLHAEGLVAANGKPFPAESIKVMIASRPPKPVVAQKAAA